MNKPDIETIMSEIVEQVKADIERDEFLNVLVLFPKVGESIQLSIRSEALLTLEWMRLLLNQTPMWMLAATAVFEDAAHHEYAALMVVAVERDEEPRAWVYPYNDADDDTVTWGSPWQAGSEDLEGPLKDMMELAASHATSSRMVYLEDLESSACSCDKCDGRLILSGKCHEGTPTYVSYEKGSGLLELKCAECDKFVVRVAVGSRI